MNLILAEETRIPRASTQEQIRSRYKVMQRQLAEG